MNSPTSRVLIVDDNEQTRDKLIELLRFSDVEVVGESTFGAAAFTWASQLEVDVILVTVEEPVARSLRTIESLSVGHHSWPVIGISAQGDRETMRKAMVSGVRDFLTEPLNAEELHATIVNIHRVEQARRAVAETGVTAGPLGTIVTIAGFKGGIGKSTVASNVAASLAQQTQQHVAFVDLDLQFGDAALMLDLVPTHTIEHLLAELDRVDPQAVNGYLTPHASRCKLLAAPTTPDAAEGIKDEDVGRVLELLAATNDFVVVDTAPHLDELSATAMDLSTIVLVVVTPEVPCIRRTKAALTLMRSWGYSRDKVKLVVNRSQKMGEVSLAEIEQVLDYPIYAQIPDDPQVAKSISLGTPVAMFDPKGNAGRAANDLTRSLTGLPKPERAGLRLRRRKPQPQPQRWTPSATYPAAVDDSWLRGSAAAPAHHQSAGPWETPEPSDLARDFEWPGGTAAKPGTSLDTDAWANSYVSRYGEPAATAGDGAYGAWPAARAPKE
jgi:pilus assembly protein CpaE